MCQSPTNLLLTFVAAASYDDDDDLFLQFSFANFFPTPPVSHLVFSSLFERSPFHHFTLKTTHAMTAQQAEAAPGGLWWNQGERERERAREERDPFAGTQKLKCTIPVRPPWVRKGKLVKSPEKAVTRGHSHFIWESRKKSIKSITSWDVKITYNWQEPGT
jgi:hypothetical protein